VAGVDDADDAEDDPDERRARRRRRVRRVVLSVLAVVVVAAAAFGFYRWTQTQYYVGVDGEVVAIYRGIPQSVGPLSLSEVVETSDVVVDDLPAFVRERLDQTIHTATLADARERVASLAEDAEPEPSPTPTPTTPTAPAATPGATAPPVGP
jgi:protein phosphatase